MTRSQSALLKCLGATPTSMLTCTNQKARKGHEITNSVSTTCTSFRFELAEKESATLKLIFDRMPVPNKSHMTGH